MKVRVREWMRRELWSKRGLWNLCALAAVPLLLLGYLWVGGVLLDRGQEVDDPDIAAYVPARESSSGARALMDMSRLVDQGKYFDGAPTDDLVRDVELLRLYANWIDRDEVDEEDDVLDRFEVDESFRRGWVAGLLSSNQFVFAALDRAAADTGFRFADPVGSKYEDERAWLSPPGCAYAWEGPVFAQIRFDAESGDTAAMTAHFARSLHVLERLKGSEGQGVLPLVTFLRCQKILVDGMSRLVDEYDFNEEDLTRLDQILASAPVVQPADWRRARICWYVGFRKYIESILDGSVLPGALYGRGKLKWPGWLVRLAFRWACQPGKMLGWMARRIADEKSVDFAPEALERQDREWKEMTKARKRQWWRPGFFMYAPYFGISHHVRSSQEGRDDIQALRKKISDRIELKRRGETPVLKKHVFGRPKDEKN